MFERNEEGKFDRERFDRAVVLFSTMLVKMGVQAEADDRDDPDDFNESMNHSCAEYLDTLDTDDLMALGNFVMGISEAQWGSLMMAIANRVFLATRE